MPSPRKSARAPDAAEVASLKRSRAARTSNLRADFNANV
jgi:hypothetical protein